MIMGANFTINNFSVVVPIYNEEEILEDSANKIILISDKLSIEYEIIFVENGSSDNTKKIAKKIEEKNKQVRVLSLPNPNYGNALKEGFQNARKDIIVSFDIDYFSESFLHSALTLDKTYAGLTASKQLPESIDGRKFIRRVATKMFVLILKILFQTNLSDTHGMKAIRNIHVKEQIDSVISTQDLFDTELILRIERSGQKIKEIPAHINEIRPSVSLIYSRIPRTLYSIIRLRYYFFKEGLKTKNL